MHIAKWIVLVLLCFSSHNEVSGATVITSILPGGMTISTPGLYVLGNDITWAPSGAVAAITITSSDVTLDMQGYKLESTTTAFSTTGIYATAGINLLIQNGTISNMGLHGINCDQFLNVLIYNIIVDGLNKSDIINYTVPAGILVSRAANVIIASCTVKNIDVTTASLAAIQLTEVIYSAVSTCLVENLLNRDGACTGIGHLLCDAARVEGCVINNLQSDFGSNLNTAGHTTIGIIPVISTNLLIQNCSVSNVTGTCDDAHGMSLFECIDAVVRKCKIKNILDGAGPAQTGAKATGIEVYASGVKVIKCSAKNIKAINPQDKQAAGFSCAQCENVEFHKCHAEDVSVVDENGNQSSTLGYGVGYGWAPDPRPAFLFPAVNILYRGCTAKNCQVGFDSWYHIDSAWEYIHTICCGIPVLDQDQAQRTLSCNPCSECGCNFGCYPTPLTVTIDNIASNNTFRHVEEHNCN